MLRRKLLLRIGLLIGGFVAGAVVALALLEGALREIDRINDDATVLIDGVQEVGAAVSSVAASPGAQPAGVAAAAARLEEALGRIGAHEATRTPGAPATVAFHRLRGLVPEFLARNAGPDRVATHEALGASVSMHAAVQDLFSALRAYVSAEQGAMGRRFRVLVLALTLSALVMVNVAVFVLLRTARVVLDPVAALVEGSRQLAAEHFEHRVKVDQNDEFAELAHAYNTLAEQLASNEERKTETLRQLAVTLNHDLNNALAVIELQLGLLDRQAGASPAQAKHLHDIRATLGHMTRTVSSLKNIRRVVLTDYAPGQKMLDLARSVEPGPGQATEPAA